MARRSDGCLIVCHFPHGEPHESEAQLHRCRLRLFDTPLEIHEIGPTIFKINQIEGLNILCQSKIKIINQKENQIKRASLEMKSHFRPKYVR